MRLLRLVAALAAASLPLAAADAQPSRVLYGFSHHAPNASVLELVTPFAVYTLPAVLRGWHDHTGVGNTPTGTQNYFVGLCSADDGCADPGVPPTLNRNYFTFRIPPSVTAISARLLLDLRPNGYLSTEPSETFLLWDVATPVAELGAASVATYQDLGSGVSYGSLAVAPGDAGTTTAVVLNAAGLAAVNAAAGGEFALGGSLDVATVPEPASVALLGGGLVALAGVAARRRRAL